MSETSPASRRPGLRARSTLAPAMSAQHADDADAPKRKSREEHLADARQLPPLEESVIDEFTDDEWDVFWTAINQA